MKKLPLLLLCCTSAYAEQETPVPVSKAPRSKVNYPSNFQVEKGWDLLISGEYLFWRANEDGLFFAQTGFQNLTLPFPPDGSMNFKGKLKKIDPEWDNGLRIGLGLNFPRAGCDVIGYWTWFSTTSTDSASGSLIPLWAEPDFDPFAGATEAKAHWDLDLNVADLEWGRSSWFGGSFSLRPFFAVRAAVIDQLLKIDYLYNTSPAAMSHLRSRSDFQGGGLRAGIDTRFALPCGFAVYGVTSGSLLYGKLNNNFRVTGDAPLASTKDHFWKGISSLQMGLGFGWDTHFAKDRLHIEFHVGWESNIWFDVNTMNHFMHQLNTGSFFKENSNLSMQGLVAGGRFDF
jgi:hypothetical protein